MRLIAIGDIHGQKEKLERLLDDVAPTGEDRLVFLGDYIDRGPDAHGVIELLINLREDRPDTVFIRGNHEQMLLDALFEAVFSAGSVPAERSVPDLELERFSELQVYLRNGGPATLASYGVDRVDALPAEHVAFLQATRFYYRQAGFLFVHAGARNDLPLAEQDEYTLLWDRTLDPGIREVHVVGHQPTTTGLPGFEAGRYRIDTGAGSKGPLTACDVLTRTFWQA